MKKELNKKNLSAISGGHMDERRKFSVVESYVLSFIPSPKTTPEELLERRKKTFTCGTTRR